jgi:hypothetical protein
VNVPVDNAVSTDDADGAPPGGGGSGDSGSGGEHEDVTELVGEEEADGETAVTTCWACRTGHPSQWEHMKDGGCLERDALYFSKA